MRPDRRDRPTRSFHDTGYEVEAALDRRRVALQSITVALLGDDIGSKALGRILRMSHRLDSISVHGLHPADEVEDARQLVRMASKLAIVGGESRKLRDPACFIRGDRHDRAPAHAQSVTVPHFMAI